MGLGIEIGRVVDLSLIFLDLGIEFNFFVFLGLNCLTWLFIKKKLKLKC